MAAKDNDEKVRESEEGHVATSSGTSRSDRSEDLDMDIEELTKTIEERIDELFRPEAEITFDFKPDVKKEVDVVSDIIKTGDVKGSEPIIEGAKSVELQEQEEVTLMELLERATVSYLSLDWEFSQENLQAMKNSIEAIESRIRPVEETRIILEILKRLLDWFSNYEQTVSAVSLALFREALQFLSKVLQRDQKIGEKEQAIVEQFRKRFNILMKQYGIKEPEIALAPVVDIKKEVIEPAVTVVEPSVTVEISSEAPGISSFEDAISEARKLRENLERENRRLRKIIEILYARPKLKPVGDRLVKVVDQYEKYTRQVSHLEAFLDRHKEDVLKSIALEEKKVLTEELTKDQAKAEPKPVSMPEVTVDKPVFIEEETISAERSYSESDRSAEAGLVREVYLFLCQGKYFAIPSDSLVKYDHLSSKKAYNLRSRGYGTLGDVKPFFKSIRHGVRGVWKDKSDRDLKSMVFKYLDIKKKFNLPQAKGEYGGVVVFASNGINNVMFIVDFVIDERVFTVRSFRPSEAPDLMGFVDLDRYRNVEVINIETLI